MKRGSKNKLPSPSSSSIITRAFQISWFPKFKQNVENPETSSKKNISKNGLDFFPTTPNSRPRFYSMDEDDPDWRLSFGGEEIAPARRSTGGLMMNPADLDHEFHFPVSGFNKSSGSRNFNDMVLDIKRMKEMEMRRGDARAKGSKRERDAIIIQDDFSKREEEEEQVVLEGKTVFNSFAVVRNSFDPQRDFRESMVEMIREKTIRGSNDLEELLACYLDLNSEEYHDVIITVFCQLWFELESRKSAMF